MKDFSKQIQQGRDFMRWVEDGNNGFVSDQNQKKPQPPLVKAPMRGEDARVKLPMDFDSLELNADFVKIIGGRESHRVYSKAPVTLLQLSFLLWATQGIKSIRGKKYATLRTVPSGGARHAFETYLAVSNVEGLKKGIYHYLPMTGELEFLGEVEAQHERVAEALMGQAWGAKAQVVFFWSMIPYRAEWRYGIYAHRVALIDAGHVCQNLYLACEAMGLGTCGVAAFDCDKTNELLQLSKEDGEFGVYCAPVGTIRPEDKAKELEFYSFVQEEGL